MTVLFLKLTVAQLIKKFPIFCATQRFIATSQKLTNEQYPEQDDSGPRPHIHFLQDKF
jgi:hypothetical protein